MRGGRPLRPLRWAASIVLGAGMIWGILPPPGIAAQDPGERDEGALFLLLPVGAQGVGLARAMTAMASPEGAFWNPAGLGGVDRSGVILYRGDHVAGDATGFSVLVRGWNLGVFGVSYGLLDFGTQALTDGTGAVLGSIAVRGHHAVLSFASALGPRLNGGVNVKRVEFRQTCRGQCADAGVRASTHALDAGIQLQPFEARPLRLGLMVAHLGPDLKVENVDQADPLPTRVRFGASYSLLGEVADEELEFRVLAEVEERPHDLGNPSLFLASELSAGTEDRVAVRGGYILGSQPQTDGAAIGLALRFERFEFGVSRSLARGGQSSEQERVHLTLAVAF